MVIRKADTSDYPQVMTLARALAHHVADPDPAGLDDEVRAASAGPHPWFECLVAEVDGRILGFVSFCRRFEIHSPRRSLWIGDLFTAEHARGQGIAKALLEAVSSHGLALRCDAIVLDVWRHNRLALAFYERLGARRVDDCLVLSLKCEHINRESLSQIPGPPGPSAK